MLYLTACPRCGHPANRYEAPNTETYVSCGHCAGITFDATDGGDPEAVTPIDPSLHDRAAADQGGAWCDQEWRKEWHRQHPPTPFVLAALPPPLGDCVICGAPAWTMTRAGLLCPECIPKTPDEAVERAWAMRHVPLPDEGRWMHAEQDSEFYAQAPIDIPSVLEMGFTCRCSCGTPAAWEVRECGEIIYVCGACYQRDFVNNRSRLTAWEAAEISSSTCRNCAGPHFTHQCPQIGAALRGEENKPAGRPAALTSIPWKPCTACGWPFQTIKDRSHCAECLTRLAEAVTYYRPETGEWITVETAHDALLRTKVIVTSHGQFHDGTQITLSLLRKMDYFAPSQDVAMPDPHWCPSCGDAWAHPGHCPTCREAGESAPLAPTACRESGEGRKPHVNADVNGGEYAPAREAANAIIAARRAAARVNWSE